MPLELKQHKNGIWYVTGSVTVWRDGRPDTTELRRSTKTRDKAVADGIRRQIENAAAEQSITGKKPALTFSQAAARYIKHGGEERFLNGAIRHLGTMSVDRITQQELDDAAFKVYPTQTPATRRRQFYAPVIAVLRSCGLNPAFRRPPDGQKRTIFFHPDKAAALIRELGASRWPNPWTPALANFLFCQGTRLGETLSIDGKRDISLSGRYAILRDTKSGKERMVHLTSRTVASLSQIPNLGDTGPLFLRYDGRRYTERSGRGYKLAAWTNALTRIGLDATEYTPHTARHSWATWFYSVTKDVVRLRQEGGWDSNEWERYVKLASGNIADAALRHGFVESKNPQNADSLPHLKMV